MPRGLRPGTRLARLVSGFTYVPDDPAGHTATPSHGTWARERSAAPPDPASDDSYPLTAACARCGQPIRLDYRLQMEWRHTPANGTRSRL